jgi:hypothetical protein
MDTLKSCQLIVRSQQREICMRLIVLSLYVFVLLILFGCSGDLTRGGAEELLNKKTDWPEKNMQFFAVTSPDASIRNRSANLPFLQALAAAGYLTPKTENFNSGQVSGGGAHGCGPVNLRPPGLLTCMPHTYITWYPTEKLKNRNEVAKIDQGGRIKADLAKARLGEVTGLAKIGENAFKVDYTQKWDLSELAEMAFRHRVASQIEPQDKIYSVIVRKYDDGWRIEQGAF